MKEKDIESLLEKMKSTVSQLSTTEKDADKIVAMVEKVLVEKWKVSVPAHFPVPDSAGFNEEQKVFLRYAHNNGKFRIGLQFHREDANGKVLSSTFHVWSECPQYLKLSSIAILPELLDAVEEQIQEKFKSTAQISTSLEPLRRALSGSS